MKKSELIQLIKEVIEEERGLTKKFDNVLSTYKNLLIQRQALIKDFVTKVKTIDDPMQIKKFKTDYIQKKKSLDAKITKYESQFEHEVTALPDPDEDELL